MATAKPRYASRRLGPASAREDARWWIAGPGQDESIRSIVGRAYEHDRWIGAFGERLTQSLGNADEPRSLERCDAGDIRALAERLSVTSRTLFSHRMREEDDRVTGPYHAVYCPRCWRQADCARKPRTFRRACQSLFQLSCPVHRSVPLRLGLLARRRCEVVYQERQPTVRARECLQWVDGFAAKLHACLFQRAPWPAHWCGDPNAAKVLLAACVTNLTQSRDYSLLHNVMVPLHLTAWLERPTGRLDPLRGDAWTALREIVDPTQRRLALWFLGWLTVSDMPIDLWPEPYAGRITYSSICVFREQAMPKRWAQVAVTILDQAVLRREQQRLAWEKSGAVPWHGCPSLWKEPAQPCQPRLEP